MIAELANYDYLFGRRIPGYTVVLADMSSLTLGSHPKVMMDLVREVKM